MRYVNDAGELEHAFFEIEAGARESGLEAAGQLFATERTFGELERELGRVTGPSGDPEDKPPTKRQLARFLPAESELRELERAQRLFGGLLDVLTVDQYGAPSYGPLGRPEGFGFHTPENVDHTLAQAIAIARWQASTGNTSGGSYMGILGWNGRAPMSDPMAWTMVRSVPWNVACGGLSGNHTPPPAGSWAPGRYPWIAEFLSDAAYADPNRFLQQISISGKAAWWSSKLSTAAGYAEIRGAMIALARWIKVLEQAYSFDAVLTLHRHWQTNRTDPGPVNFADRVFEEYVKLAESVPAPAPVDPTIALNARIGSKDGAFDRAGVAVAALERGVAADIAAIRAELVSGRQA